MSAAIPMFLLATDATWDSARRPGDVYEETQDSFQGTHAESPTPSNLLSRFRLVELLNEEGEDEFGAAGPTWFAFRSALKLILAAEQKVSLPGSPSVDSKGGIRFTWRWDEREVRLICPAEPAEQSYIYVQDGDEPTILHSVSPETLVSKLLWLSGDVAL